MQVPPRDGRIAVAVGDHLALFGDLDAALHRAGRLGQDSAVGRTAAAPDAPAAPVEQFQPDVLRPAQVAEPLLGEIHAPVRGEIAAVFAAVGIAEHDLLVIAAPGEGGAVVRHGEQCGHDPRRVFEIVHRLEQGDDVHVIFDPDGVRQQQQGQHVAGRGAHAGDHGVDHRRAILGVRGGDHAPGSDDLVGRRGKIRLDREQRARIDDLAEQLGLLFIFRQRQVIRADLVLAQDFVEGGGVQARILPDFERDEVQPEQVDLPDQPVQHPTRRPLAAPLAQAVRQQAQIVAQFLAGTVAVGLQRERDQVQRLAIQFAGKVRRLTPVLHEGPQRLRYRDVARRLGQVLAQVRDLFQVDAARGLAQRGQGVQRDLRRDVRVTVAIPTDPRGVVQDGRQRGPVRAGIVGFQRSAQIGLDVQRDVHDHRSDEVDAELDFVSHRRPRGAGRVGLPQFLDLLGQRRLQRPLLAGQQARRIAPGHHLRDVAQLDQHLLALGFGGMGRHDQPDAHPLQLGAQVVRRDPRRSQRGHGAVHRFAADALALALAQHPDALLVFGDVDQLKIVAEGFDQHAALIQVQIANEIDQGGMGGLIVAAARFGGGPHLLHGVERGIAVQLADHGAEQVAQQVDVGAESARGVGVIEHHGHPILSVFATPDHTTTRPSLPPRGTRCYTGVEHP